MRTIQLSFIWALFICQLSIFASDCTIDSIDEFNKLSHFAEKADNAAPSESCSEGTNLSLIGTIVDFSAEENSTNTVANIIDDSTDNRWSVEGFPQFATIDLGDTYSVNEINLVTLENRDYQFIVEGSISSATSGFSTLVDASDNTDEGTINEAFSTQTVRYVKLTITGANTYSGEWSSIEKFEIICAGDKTITDPTENLTVSSIDNFDTEGNSQIVKVVADVDWTVSENSSWISLNTTGGSNNGSFTITASENTSDNDRTTTVTITGSNISRTINIRQEGTATTVTGLNPNVPPSENFNLTNWNISVPIDRDGDSGISTTIERAEFNDGYELKDKDGRDYFFTGADGGMVFRNYPKGAPKTSSGTSYSRNELREIFTDDTGASKPKNNWYFSSSSDLDSDAGGVNGVLTATLAVNHVTVDGIQLHQGRVVIGQIHASENEPNRLYYHKLPEYTKGALYVAHEDNNGDELWYNIFGNFIQDGGNSHLLNEDIQEPEDGIELNEKFSYKIEVIGTDQWVTISREGKEDIVKYFDMSQSDYENDYMYFKAGVYSQNSTTDIDDDYDQVTFYELSQSHDETTTNPTEKLTVTSVDDFDADGDSQTININANVDWTVSESSSWISLNATSGSNNGSFTITTSENTSTDDRSDTVTVSGGDITISITVLQEGTSTTDIGLDPNRPPSENFDLTNFNINVPIDRGRTINTGISTNIQRYELNDGYEAKDVDGRDYFYTGADGGMVFKNYPKDAPKTSPNTSYSRTELRGIFTNDTITQQPKNNWYFSSSNDISSDAGGVDGVLTATLAVNHVTMDGNSNHKGRVIIGQIHGSDNEPCRLYYHKLPEHNRGAIYVVHEENDKDETWYNIIGNYIEHGEDSGDLNDDIEESSDGIELDEQFSYKIEVIGNDQWVTISRPGKADITQYIDMANSGYEDDYMYFKAGVYSQNNSTDLDDDYDQATFYALSQTNGGNTLSTDENVIDSLMNNVNVYPNPFTDSVKVDFSENTLVPIVKINVCDVLGRVVLNVDKDAQNELTEIDVNFSSGFYFIQLLDINGNVVAVKKVVKE